MLDNKLGLTSSAALAREEERISKKKAVALFEEIYEFAGKLRTVNIAKGNFRFAPLMYLEAALQNIDKMPQGFQKM